QRAIDPIGRRRDSELPLFRGWCLDDVLVINDAGHHLGGRRQVASNALMTHRSEQPLDRARQLLPTRRGILRGAGGETEVASGCLFGVHRPRSSPSTMSTWSTSAISSSTTTTTRGPHRTESQTRPRTMSWLC